MIKPLYNNVLLRKEKVSKETLSGIIISSKDEDEEFAIVEALSDSKQVKIGDNTYDLSIKVGDKVMYKKYSGTEVKYEDKEYILIKVEDILGVIE